MPDQDDASTPVDASPNSNQMAPYAAVLAKAFDKLTSQVLIFLLAYVILLIGVAVFGSQLTTTMRNLLYVIPLLGVVGFVLEKRRKIVKNGREKGIDVRARKVSGSASVIGVRGATADVPENVTLRSDMRRIGPSSAEWNTVMLPNNMTARRQEATCST